MGIANEKENSFSNLYFWITLESVGLVAAGRKNPGKVWGISFLAENNFSWFGWLDWFWLWSKITAREFGYVLESDL